MAYTSFNGNVDGRCVLSLSGAGFVVVCVRGKSWLMCVFYYTWWPSILAFRLSANDAGADGLLPAEDQPPPPSPVSITACVVAFVV